MPRFWRKRSLRFVSAAKFYCQLTWPSKTFKKRESYSGDFISYFFCSSVGFCSLPSKTNGSSANSPPTANKPRPSAANGWTPTRRKRARPPSARRKKDRRCAAFTRKPPAADASPAGPGPAPPIDFHEKKNGAPLRAPFFSMLSARRSGAVPKIPPTDRPPRPLDLPLSAVSRALFGVDGQDQHQDAEGVGGIGDVQNVGVRPVEELL